MPRRALLLLPALVATACVVGDADPEPSALEAPTFEADPEGEPADPEPEPADPEPEPAGPEPTDDAADDTAGPDANDATGPDANDAATADADRPSGPGDDGAAGAAPPEPTGPTSGEEEPPEDGDDGPDEPRPLRSRVSDPRGDTESARPTPGPRHADLVGGLLERHPEDGYRLALDLDGGAPEGARDGDHTMNVATFYDLTGDGHVDVEVWANLADGGWDTAFFDNRAGEAAYAADDDITVDVEDGRLVLRFPLAVLDGAERLRWAVASEWGRYEQLGSPLSVRDEMPDEGAPAPFPG